LGILAVPAPLLAMTDDLPGAQATTTQALSLSPHAANQGQAQGQASPSDLGSTHLSALATTLRCRCAVVIRWPTLTRRGRMREPLCIKKLADNLSRLKSWIIWWRAMAQKF
jgi:hypothetical protein